MRVTMAIGGAWLGLTQSAPVLAAIILACGAYMTISAAVSRKGE